MKLKFYHRHPFSIGLIIIILFLSLSYQLITDIVQHERQRDYKNWQITLGVMVDNHANAIDQWITKQFTTLNKLSQNGSVQLYSQQLQRRSEKNTDSEPAQISYLRNLLQVTASQNDFFDNDDQVPANINREANNGIALLNKEGAIITATQGINRPTEELKQAIMNVLEAGKPAIFDLELNRNNRPQLGFIVPVYALQVQTGKRQAVAAIYGFKDVTVSLFDLLKSASKTTPSAETNLLRQESGTIRYLTPLADGTPAFSRQLSANDKNLAAAYAIKHPGSFSEKLDYAGQQVLFTSRVLNNVPWIIMQKIDTKEALQQANRDRKFLLMTLCLTVMIVVFLLIAAWWYGSSVRAKKTAYELLKKSEDLEVKTNLLDAINENIQDFIFMTDESGALIFANHNLARQFKTSHEDLKGKSLSTIFGPVAAQILLPLLKSSLTKEKTSTQAISLEINGQMCHLHATFSPVHLQNQLKNAVLITCHDVTELHESQKAQEALMSQLIKAMMRAIDLHDPYSANHSSKTATIADEIGQVMNLPPSDLHTLETAANLCNIGKIFIPKELLTKTDDLSDEEQDELKQEAAFATEILSGIQFLGPVMETITQKHEHIDGTGYPNGLGNEALAPTSKILAVANAFVAMISPRAYRSGLSVQQGMAEILKKSDKQFDRKVIAALFHVVENKIDWLVWH